MLSNRVRGIYKTKKILCVWNKLNLNNVKVIFFLNKILHLDNITIGYFIFKQRKLFRKLDFF